MRGRPDKRPDRHSQGNTRQRPGLTEDEVQELYEAFNLFDSEGTGKVDPREIKAAMKELGFESRNPIIYNMVSELETIGREIDFQEYLDALSSNIGDKFNKKGINKIFDMFDNDRSGFVTSENISRVAKELGENISKRDIEDILQRTASHGGQISREDFYHIMSRSNF